jgi:hypothetical protein
MVTSFGGDNYTAHCCAASFGAAAIESGEQLWESEFRLRWNDGSYAHVREQGFIVRDPAGRPLQCSARSRILPNATTPMSSASDSRRRRDRHGELTASASDQPADLRHSEQRCAMPSEMLLDAGEHSSIALRPILSDIRDDDLRASEVIRHIRGLANKRQIDFDRFDINELVRAVVRPWSSPP